MFEDMLSKEMIPVVKVHCRGVVHRVVGEEFISFYHEKKSIFLHEVDSF
jgi:hypothetical protein